MVIPEQNLLTFSSQVYFLFDTSRTLGLLTDLYMSLSQ